MELPINTDLDAITVISPMFDGQDKKDQDRAVWCATARTACVCDGVTTSPFAAEAAGIVTQFSPVIFGADCESKLKTVCDLLKVLRNEKQRSRIFMPQDMSDVAAAMLQEAASQKMKDSFQTTMVAAKFTHDDQSVMASVLRCGDSIFLAFSAESELLAISPSDDKECNSQIPSAANTAHASETSDTICFNAGNELLVKVVGRCSEQPQLAVQSGIKKNCLANWFVCTALDICSSNTAGRRTDCCQPIEFRRGDLLLVPRYLAGTLKEPGLPGYVRIPYSPWIYTTKSSAKTKYNGSFRRGSAATAVLPDHFYTGGWIQFEDRFPADASFVLCSDGFYSCFDDAASLWSWLNCHKPQLENPAEQQHLCEELHGYLKKERSDDDISFVWVYANEAADDHFGSKTCRRSK